MRINSKVVFKVQIELSQSIFKLICPSIFLSPLLPTPSIPSPEGIVKKQKKKKKNTHTRGEGKYHQHLKETEVSRTYHELGMRKHAGT